jgi:cell division protein FtsX
MSSPSSYQKRRLFSSYFWVVISLFLVLFMLGLQGFFLLNSQKLADYFREQVPMSIYFKDTAKEVEMRQLEKTLQMADYTKNAVFVSSEEGAQRTKEDLGEDFVAKLDGFNPIPNSIDVRLNAKFVTATEIQQRKRKTHLFLDADCFWNFYSYCLFTHQQLHKVERLCQAIYHKNHANGRCNQRFYTQTFYPNQH